MSANGHHAAKGHPKPAAAEQSAASILEAFTEGLTEKTRQSPYAMVAAALGVGYVIGGGLFTRTTARVLELGARLAMIPAVREPLLDIAEQALDSALSKTAALTTDDQKPTKS